MWLSGRVPTHRPTLAHAHVPLGATQAAQVGMASGQEFSRVVFVANGDRLLKFIFLPADLEMIGYSVVELLYTTIAESFLFMK